MNIFNEPTLCTIIYYDFSKKNTIETANAYFSDDTGVIFIKGKINLNESKKIISGELVWQRHICEKRGWFSKTCHWERFTDGTRIQIFKESIVMTKEIMIKNSFTDSCDGSFIQGINVEKWELDEEDIE